MISWTPYAMVAALSLSNQKMSPILELAAGVLAKTSMIWTSIINIFYDRQIKSKINKTFS